jgi:hypothetical protein
MRRLSILCAAAGIAVTALVATTPAEAAFHVIRWQDTGFCQVQDQSLPMMPWLAHYTTVTHRLPSFTKAMAVKDVLVRKGACKL